MKRTVITLVGTTDGTALNLAVGGGRALYLEPGANVSFPESPNLIGGFSGNSVGAGVSGATIGGGGEPTAANSVSADFGTVSGGVQNTVSRDGGSVAGGALNTASGLDASVASGYNSIASGDFSFAAGYRAKAMARARSSGPTTTLSTSTRTAPTRSTCAQPGGPPRLRDRRLR
jgi:hypothetical protein